MLNKFLIVICLLLYACQKHKVQNLDIEVTGTVNDQNNNGIANVTIYINRGTPDWFSLYYSKYDSIFTNVSGKYHYLIKNDGYMYQVCCKLPPGFSIITQGCKEVDHSVINSQPVSNVINFLLLP